ncbi:hypothetical protein [Luteibacter sp. CQ10]|uniref:hypothetical protein n=1 Tax=Luteibacter sp. CQ10 TaxID=2805821 RepID=UPI0034A4DDFB
MTTSKGLNEKDIHVLQYYADRGNRELYWNYLAQLPGNDGYGELALGVVRNDNMPGATANAYAAAYAREHDQRTLTERDWDNFGIDLIRRDLAYRTAFVNKGEYGHALNLPVLRVQQAHDKAFNNINVDPNAWTPRKLLQAARTHGEDEAEKMWTSLLSNDVVGLERFKDTVWELIDNRSMSWRDGAEYFADMTSAYVTAMGERSHLPPDIVGSQRHYHVRDGHGDWTRVHIPYMSSDLMRSVSEVKDPETLRQLEDTYRLRLDRAAARDAFAPDDPGKLVASPHPLADTRPTVSMPKPGDDPLYATLRHQLPFDVSDDKVAEVALEARQAGIRRPAQLESVQIHDDRIVCEAINHGPWVDVELLTSAPPKEQSLDLAQQFDQQAMAMEAQRQMAVQHAGPTMRI